MSNRKYELSQHFLASPRRALELIGHSNIKKRDLVLDIGAGSGVITAALAKRAREVWAIEPDAETAMRLRANLKRFGLTNVLVFEEDFLKMRLPEGSYKVFANPPFHISAKILYRLLNLENRDGKIVREAGTESFSDESEFNYPEAIYLILQKQMALKLIQTDRHYTSQLGYLMQEMYDTRIRLPLRPTDFTPPPAVPTVLFEAKRRKY